MKTTAPVREKFLPVSLPQIDQEEIDEVVDSLKSGWITTGPKVIQFEEKFKEAVGAPFTVALNSGTAALHISYLTAGIGPGDEVITTPMTFAATVNMILLVGAKPVLVDIDPKTLNIDPELIAKAITPKTKAIVPVHFAGLACEMDEISKLAKENDLVVIEDAAHAVGSTYHGKKIGQISRFTCFSFHPMKNLTTGEGGLVAAQNEEDAEKLRRLRFHGIDKDAWKRYDKKGSASYGVHELGFKYNMLDLQAAIGLHQLDKLDQFNQRRLKLAQSYIDAFSSIDRLECPPAGPNDRLHTWHLFPVQFDIDKIGKNREKIMNDLKVENIGTGVHYEAIHLHPFFSKALDYKRGDFPHAEKMSDRVLSLPLFPKMTDQDAQDVVEAVKKILN